MAELAYKALLSDFRHIDSASVHILLVEAAPRILPTFPEKLAQQAHEALTRLGVDVRTNTAVEDIDEHGVVIAGKHLAAHTVVWMAGVHGTSSGRWIGADLDTAGRVKVARNLSIPGHRNIFVVGDDASVIQKGKPLPGLAPVAIQEGQYVSSVIAAQAAGKQHKRTFRYRNRGMLATVGRSYGVVSMGKMRLSGLSAWVMWLFVHIFFLIGYRNRFIVLFQWALAYFSFKRAARVILANEDE